MLVIGWFSGGITSAVAIKKCVDSGSNMQIYFFETGQHHPDNMRFLKDCEKWFGQKIHIMRNKKAGSVKQVLEKGYINSPGGAFCTHQLKKKVRQQLEGLIDYDAQIFGFEYSPKQIKRAERFVEQYPEAKGIFPLIEGKITKDDCFKEVTRAGIELPEMYNLGFNNSNCIGCVKGGKGYWNKTRKLFPEIFEQTAKLERMAGHSCINGMFLDELPVDAGRHDDISLPDCGVICEIEMMGTA
jgi:3'-phosphoadenosine 5'-phosphosulfate sulfotransferase (PAPS reductase)/FAD synthetase